MAEFGPPSNDDTTEKGASGPLRSFWRCRMKANAALNDSEAAGNAAETDAKPMPVIVFGKDEKGKAHASFFAASDAELATKAAGLMSMQALRVTSDKLRQLGRKLPKGRVFGSGRAFVPFVEAGTYEQLVAFSEAASSPDAASGESQENGEASAGLAEPPLAVGDVVFASDGPGEGWWEAVVSEINDGLYVLYWRDSANEPKFVRRRWQLGSLPPPASKSAATQ
jgi:hypothetical protein